MAQRRHRWHPVCPPPQGLVRPVRRDPAGVGGPTRGAAGGPRWRRTSQGFYVPADVDGSVPEQRILEQSVRLPAGGAVTGWAACRLWGAAFFDGLLPDGRTPMPVPLAIHGGNVRGDSSVRLMRDPLEPGEVVHRFGVPCVRVLRAVFDAMRTGGDLREAVVAMDMMAAAEKVSLRRMTGYLPTQTGRRGLPLVTRALTWPARTAAHPTRRALGWSGCWTQGSRHHG